MKPAEKYVDVSNNNDTNDKQFAEEQRASGFTRFSEWNGKVDCGDPQQHMN